MDEPRQSMGVGLLSAPTTQFVQKFRWTLKSEGLDEILIVKAKVFFRAKLVDFEVYELIELGTGKGIQAQDWSEENFNSKTLTLTTYDGCGTPIYRYVFEGLKLCGDTVEYDYSQSGPIVRKFQVKFKNYQRTVFQQDRSINPKEDADENQASGNCPEELRKALK